MIEKLENIILGLEARLLTGNADTREQIDKLKQIIKEIENENN